MDYKKIGEIYYIRMDRDDEIISNILSNRIILDRESDDFGRQSGTVGGIIR